MLESIGKITAETYKRIYIGREFLSLKRRRLFCETFLAMRSEKKRLFSQAI